MQTEYLTNDQMELGFNSSAPRCNHGSNRRQTRLERAAWWFSRMRRVVDNAISWTPKPTPPPQQLWLAR
jgi:hypothetical protein